MTYWCRFEFPIWNFVSISTSYLNVGSSYFQKVYELENQRKHQSDEEEGDPTKIIPSVDEASRPRAHHHHGDGNNW